MHNLPLRFVAPLLAFVAGVACSKPSSDASRENSAASAISRDAQDAGAHGSVAATATGGTDWTGSYTLRGTLDKNRPVTGTLMLRALDSAQAAYAPALTMVRRTYPSYNGPLYAATLSLTGSGDNMHSEFSCALGPAAPPNVVCRPSSSLKGLEDAVLVLDPSGQAVLTGSHTEGVTVAYGKLAWTKS